MARNGDDEDFDLDGAAEELAGDWAEDPAKVKEAWDEILCSDDLATSGHDVAAALVGDPSNLNARAVRLHSYISAKVFVRLTEMARDEVVKRRKQAELDRGEDEYWDKKDRGEL